MAEGGAHKTIFDRKLDRVTANFTALTPVSFLARAAAVYPDKAAVIHGDVRYSYAQFWDRARRLASALQQRGIGLGDTVSIMAPNVPAMLDAHYGVPMLGAVLNPLNYRLDHRTIAFILDHCQSKVLITDREFCDAVKPALALLNKPPLVIDIDDPLFHGGERLGEMDYESFIAQGDPDFEWRRPEDEWQALALNYTSGTTGDPKGVVFHHRGAFLNAVGNMLEFGLDDRSVYLWTLPMFHCNGWTYTWAVTAATATHVCLRQVDPALIFSMIARHQVSHMCGAPIVLTMLIHAPDEQKSTFPQTVDVATGGAAPPSAVIAAMEKMGFRVLHLYGLTETYGPATLCAWQDDWDGLSPDGQAEKMARQGIKYVTQENLMIADPDNMVEAPWDGETIGELMLRGNTVMKGYLNNPQATKRAFHGGWFHTGDLGVRHADGYVEIKDRSKDIIISGGENISSLEVEEVLYLHPEVMEAAVVARPDDRWGETPCAFVTLKPGASAVSEADIIAYCRDSMAHYKIPKTVLFGPLPKTSTGKIQKYLLRERAAQL